MKNREGNEPLMLWNIPAELKMQFKIKCVEKGVTMQDAVISFLQKFVK